MARILLTTWASPGTLRPYIRIARRLADLGHEAIVASGLGARRSVETHGVAFHPMRPDLDPDNAGLMRRVLDPRRGSEVLVEELIAPAVRDAFEDLLPIARDADVIVSHPLTFAAPLAAAFLEKRWLSTVLTPASFLSIHDFPVPPQAPALGNALVLGPVAGWLMRTVARGLSAPWMGPVRALRADLGLADAGAPLFEGQFSPYGTLALFSRVLADPQPDWPPRTTIAGFAFDAASEALPAPLASFLDAGEAPLVFAFDRSAARTADLQRAAVDAAARLGRRAVLLGSRPRAIRAANPIQPDVLALDDAPLDLLMPRAAAVVHAGGIGTLAEALRAGRPMVIVPSAHDQPDNARRAGRLGVARVVPPAQASGEELAAELELLQDDPEYARAATEVAQLVGGEDGVGVACQRVLELAAGGIIAAGA